MLKGRFYLFSCDKCGEEVYTVNFPKDFIYLPKSFTRGVLEHRHKKCATKEEMVEWEKNREKYKGRMEFYH